MAKWIDVIPESDFPGDRTVVEYDGELIAIFKLDDGYYAINDECSHAEASLSEGEIVEDCKIECPMHGALFDIRSGKNVGFPAVIPVKSYPVKVEKGMIMVGVDE